MLRLPMTIRFLSLLCLVSIACVFPLAASAQGESRPSAADSQPDSSPAEAKDATSFYVIPVQGAIDQPTLYAIRSGVKAAIEGEHDYVVLDMNTPGGRLDSTLEIMEVLDRFPGKTVTYVNDEAISAGAIIASVTQEIYFAPRGTMGSAEPVTGQGQDIDESMKRKLMSYLNAKMEAYTDQYPFRSEVIRAMMDPEYEFKIGDEVISPKGELLNLNAKRAHEEFGDPPRPLLGSGIVEDLDQLLNSLAAGSDPVITRFEATWSLNLAEFIVGLAPVLLAVAFITVYIEFQTPGFGIFGITGVTCFLIAIFGHNVAGLSGQEPLLLFLVGVLFLALELFVLPGTLLFAIPGFLIMIASLIWAMTDIWPAGTPDYEFTWDMLERPLRNLIGGSLLGGMMILVLIRFLPKTFIWDRLVLKTAIVGNSQMYHLSENEMPTEISTGAAGVAATDLMPSGEVEINGKRYEARLDLGSVQRGTPVRVIKKSDFGYIVEEIES